MPYKSEAQRKFFNANRKALASQGVDVDEWNAESKGKKLPKKVKAAKKEAEVIRDALERTKATLAKRATLRDLLYRG